MRAALLERKKERELGALELNFVLGQTLLVPLISSYSSSTESCCFSLLFLFLFASFFLKGASAAAAAAALDLNLELKIDEMREGVRAVVVVFFLPPLLLLSRPFGSFNHCTNFPFAFRRSVSSSRIPSVELSKAEQSREERKQVKESQFNSVGGRWRLIRRRAVLRLVKTISSGSRQLFPSLLPFTPSLLLIVVLLLLVCVCDVPSAFFFFFFYAHFLAALLKRIGINNLNFLQNDNDDDDDNDGDALPVVFDVTTSKRKWQKATTVTIVTVLVMH